MDASYVKLFVWVASILAAVGSGLVGGVFFAFSSFVMRGLARIPAPQGIAAMQSINITVISPLFMGVFLGTALFCLSLTIYSLTSLKHPGSLNLVIASLLYLLGSIAVTLIFNVPLNDKLAKADPTTADAAQLWTGYINSWLMWNHIRALSSISAAVMFVTSLFQVRSTN